MGRGQAFRFAKRTMQDLTLFLAFTFDFEQIAFPIHSIHIS